MPEIVIDDLARKFGVPDADILHADQHADQRTKTGRNGFQKLIGGGPTINETLEIGCWHQRGVTQIVHAMPASWRYDPRTKERELTERTVRRWLA